MRFLELSVLDSKTFSIAGASWAFSATGAIEGVNKIATGSLVSLSEQELIDCDMSYNSGCSGGLMDSAFRWATEHGGIHTTKEYPYLAGESACNEKKVHVHFANTYINLNDMYYLMPNLGALQFQWKAVTIDGYSGVLPNDEEQMLQAVASQPVSAGICARERAFQFYSKVRWQSSFWVKVFYVLSAFTGWSAGDL